MRHNNLPDKSIKGAGGLETYINRFFATRNIDKTYNDFVTLLNYDKIPINTRAKQLGIVSSTFKNWVNLYQATEHI